MPEAASIEAAKDVLRALRTDVGAAKELNGRNDVPSFLTPP